MSSKFTVIIVLICLSTKGLARFEPEDSMIIDPEERHNTESWNDKNSYRYPKRWDDIWADSSVGYRVNAGSLNASRFNYEDDVMIAPRPLEEFTAAFTQSRREDLVDQTTEREIRVGWRFIDGMRISLLGDVNTLKEFGDLGAALALHESVNDRTEVYYWSVDHYYASKRSDETASRNDHSHTYGLRSFRSLRSSGFGWNLKFEMDTPIDWTLPSSGWIYSYDQRRLDARVDVPIDLGLVFYGSFESSRKFEKKIALTGGLDGSVFKTMHRRALVSEVGIEYKTEDESQYQAAIQSVKRDVAYEYGSANSSFTSWSETMGPREVRRNEWGLVVTRHKPVTSKFAFQHGMMVNDVYIREDSALWKAVEIKYQALFDFTLNDNSHMCINTTWDLDQIARDVPYSSKKPFRPWGGGDLQFMMRL